MNFDIISNTRQSKNYSATVHPQLLKKPEQKMSLYCCTTPCHLTCYYQKDLYCLLQTEQKNMYYCYLCLMNSYFNYQVQLFWVRNKTISRLGIIESKVVLTRVFWCHDFFFKSPTTCLFCFFLCQPDFLFFSAPCLFIRGGEEGNSLSYTGFKCSISLKEQTLPFQFKYQIHLKKF